MKKCKRCGELFDSRNCKPCNKAAVNVYYAANRDEVKKSKAAYRAANPEKIKAIKSAYREKNADQINSDMSAYRKSHPEEIRRHSQNRRARVLLSDGHLSKGLAERLIKLQKGKCACCKEPLGDNYNLDHITPLSRGGSNTDDNIQLLTQRCNKQKSAKDPIDFMQSRGFLI